MVRGVKETSEGFNTIISRRVVAVCGAQNGLSLVSGANDVLLNSTKLRKVLGGQAGVSSPIIFTHFSP